MDDNNKKKKEIECELSMLLNMYIYLKYKNSNSLIIKNINLLEEQIYNGTKYKLDKSFYLTGKKTLKQCLKQTFEDQN